MEIVISILLFVSFFLSLALYLLWNKYGERKENIVTLEENLNHSNNVIVFFQNKFKDVIVIEDEIQKLSHQKAGLLTEVTNIQKEYQDKHHIFQELKQRISLYDEEVELIEQGFYKPHFDFDRSEQYKQKISSLRATQKQMLKDKEAVVCDTEWSVGGSKAEGKKMTDRGIKLTLRAFNNECEAAISNVQWNNVNKMLERINDAFQSINKLNESNKIVILKDYLDLKIDELHAVYEFEEKKKQEKEEQAELRRQMKEEEKLEREKVAAEKEEEKYQSLLLKAEAEASKARAGDMDRLSAEIAMLTQKLSEAHAKSERAKSMAEQTKAGHVYIISNVGSFGDDVYKIGMTRRLDPVERVDELGDASVPFYFDIHAMIYSDNAPALENALHKSFASKRINLVNLRKEFFRVSLSEIENEVKKISPQSEFIMTAQAEEFNKSQMIRNEKLSIPLVVEDILPSSIG